MPEEVWEDADGDGVVSWDEFNGPKGEPQKAPDYFKVGTLTRLLQADYFKVQGRYSKEECALSAHSLHTRCTLAAHSLHTRCALAAHSLPCALAAYSLPAPLRRRSTPTATGS
jgi:hypothetical protein